MPRTKGAANKDNEQRKRSILQRIWSHLRQRQGKAVSLREMAAAGKVGLATISHHFGKRDDVIAAILQAKHFEGEEALRILAQPQADFSQSIAAALAHLSTGLEDYDVGDLLGVGLAEGIDHDKLGPVFVEEGLEPIIQAAMARLQVHQARGEMRPDSDVRVAALSLISPLLIGYLHQTSLNGKAAYPMDMEQLHQQICEAFVRGYGTQAEQ